MSTNADTLINREEFDRCSLELWHEEVVKYGENDPATVATWAAIELLNRRLFGPRKPAKP